MKSLHALAIAAALMIGGTAANAQSNPNADPRPLPAPSQDSNKPYSNEAPTTPPKAAPNVGSRPIGPPAANSQTESNPNNPGADLKKLDKQGRGGQQQ
jgi:hypothetical protein